MQTKISRRLAGVIDALPLRPGIRILEIGCGPGAAAREIVRRHKNVFVLAIDRSAKAIEQATGSSMDGIAEGSIQFQQIAIEEFQWPSTEPLFDLAFAIRVGALDGRHPKLEEIALRNIAKALADKGKLYIDGGNPLREISLDRFRNERKK